MKRRTITLRINWIGVLLLCVSALPHDSLGQSRRLEWNAYGHDPQHSAIGAVASQPFGQIRWQTPVDLAPWYSGNELLIHYGSPLVSRRNTVILPVKTGASGGFQVEGRLGADGSLLWTQSSDFVLPPHDWVPSFGPVLSRGKVWIPAAGGTVLRRSRMDSSLVPRVRQIAFYGTTAYQSSQSAYAASVFINTPLVADSRGNIYFGFQVTGPTPLNLQSGIARVTAGGHGRWVSAATAAGDMSITKVAHNSAPALSQDGHTLYVAVNGTSGFSSGPGYVLALDSRSLATLAKARPKDPNTGNDALFHDDGTSSPTVGPDGDVYFGVLESPFGSHHLRGWLMHYGAALAAKGVPGSFGWDDTPSIVPASMVPSYAGTSSYLLMTKYNNYASAGGDGDNRLAVLDPNDSMADPILPSVNVMREVFTVAGPTPDSEFPGNPTAVREWCINTAAIDPATKSILANSEDGKLYRWDMVSGALTESIVLTPGVGEAYTPTLIGADGTVFAINNATLFAVGAP